MATPTRETSATGPIPQINTSGDRDPSPRYYRAGFQAWDPPLWITKRHLRSIENGENVVPVRYLNFLNPPYPAFEDIEENQRVAVVRSPAKYLYSPLFLVFIVLVAEISGKLPLPQLPVLHVPGQVWSTLLLALLSIQLYLSWWGHVCYMDRSTISAFTGWYTPDVSFNIKRKDINGFDVVIHRPKWLFGERWLNHAMMVVNRVALPSSEIGPINNYKAIEGILRGIQEEPGDAAAGDRADQLDLANQQLAATLATNKLLSEVCNRLSDLTVALQLPAREAVSRAVVVKPPDPPPVKTPGSASAHDTIRQPPPGNSPVPPV